MLQNRVKFTEEEKKKVESLLELDDSNFCRHEVGKRIRENFKARGWLRNRERGNPSKGFKKGWGKKKLAGGEDF
jgi:hypothetical protein